MLTLGWSDGNSVIPMMLSMLSSAKVENRLAPMRDGIDKRTSGYQRRKESMRKSTDILVEMVSLAMKAGTAARHLVFDSWFAFPDIIRRIKALEMDTVYMLKDTKNVKYELKGWPLTLKELYNNVRKRRGRAKVLAEVLVTIGQDDTRRPGAGKGRVRTGSELKEVAGASFYRHDVDRRGDHQALRSPLGHRSVLQDGQVVSEPGKGVPEPFLRGPGCPGNLGLLPLHHAGTDQKGKHRSADARQLVPRC